MKEKLRFVKYGTALVILLTSACRSPNIEEKYFTLLSAEVTGVDFSNDLVYDKDFNIYTYRNFYNGGGVALGDINGDDLVDIYFSGNMQSNRLYLNKGDFTFEDITLQAEVAGQAAWSTGVTMADVNGDGQLDIYVCNSGDLAGDKKQNELFINLGASEDGVVRFEEQAEKYGLADQGYGTHAAFFDYDKDGDLDAYLLNNSYRSIFDFNRMKNQRPVRDEKGGDKLLRNDGETFTDVSEEAGIYGSEIGFGLGVTVSDVDRDGWLDIFVSNDFFERDYLYINNRDGSFTEDLENQIMSLSVASMGADIADLNNDGYPEIFVTEMLPEDEARFKTKMTFENWDTYQYNLNNGYYHQFTRNVLQLNHGDGCFSEIGRLAGVEATDWSWGALLADFDNDGLKDLFVANGLYKDIIDQDFINFVSNEEIIRQYVTDDGINYKKLIDTIPSNPISNYLFKNLGDLRFENKAQEWGLATPSHSNGAAYADLDNDGDLDLVVSNVNAPAFLYRNESNTLAKANHYLKIRLQGSGKNPYAVGASVTLQVGDLTFYQENIPVRGFQSSVEPRLNFGLGSISQIDTITITWPDGSISLLQGVPVDQTLTITQRDLPSQERNTQKRIDSDADPIFREVTDSLPWLYRHVENTFVDFDRDRLLYHMISTEGPRIAVADVNGDDIEDFFITGAYGSASALYVQQPDGHFLPTNQSVLTWDRGSEDVDCTFFDADQDGDQDLYITRGGNEFHISTDILADQLYLNDGQGVLSRSPQYLPTLKFESSSCVKAADYDGDGDEDLFVGTRIKPGYYGSAVSGYILRNDGQGKLQNVSKQIAPDLLNIGMITDASWIDYDLDEDLDLIVVGEWMPITFLRNEGGRFKLDEKALSNEKTRGWWNCVKAADFDDDGDLDVVLGNHGLNSRFKASSEKPISLHIHDFDQNGTPDPIICQFNGEKSYPMVLRHDLVMQLPHLKKKYVNYQDYHSQTIHDIFDEQLIRESTTLEVHRLETSYLENNGDGTFALHALPVATQFSPIYGLLIEDFDRDGRLDILMGGNLYGVKPEVGRYDANHGLVLKGDGAGSFQALPSKVTGLKVLGEVRDLATITAGGRQLVLVARNNDRMQVFQY